jgi:hypothetical protein
MDADSGAGSPICCDCAGHGEFANNKKQLRGIVKVKRPTPARWKDTLDPPTGQIPNVWAQTPERPTRSSSKLTTSHSFPNLLCFR